MTVHEQATESDYFSAIDDLLREEGEQGSGHINASELTSGLFYGYVVVDIEGLVKNLGSDRRLAAEVVGKLVHLVATVSPGAKKGSTAPYSYSHLVLAEAGRAQPRTLANAFLEPVVARGNLIQNSYQATAAFLRDFDQMYGMAPTELRIHAGMRTALTFGEESRACPQTQASQTRSDANSTNPRKFAADFSYRVATRR
jgi:CRISPR system Cascade subunit CasC